MLSASDFSSRNATAKALGDEMGSKGNYRGRLASWIAGKTRMSAETAFAYGETMRAHGGLPGGGASALYLNGQYEAFVSQLKESASLTALCCIPLGSDESSALLDALLKALDVDREELRLTGLSVTTVLAAARQTKKLAGPSDERVRHIAVKAAIAVAVASLRERRDERSAELQALGDLENLAAMARAHLRGDKPSYAAPMPRVASKLALNILGTHGAPQAMLWDLAYRALGESWLIPALPSIADDVERAHLRALYTASSHFFNLMALGAIS